jgi:predicted transposase YbfD/YdcC
VPPPPRNKANLANKIEFELSFALSKLKQQGRLENPARGVWRIPSDSNVVLEVGSSRHPAGQRREGRPI